MTKPSDYGWFFCAVKIKNHYLIFGVRLSGVYALLKSLHCSGYISNR